MSRRTIPELLERPAEEHDLDWLHEALQWAVDLEFATIPVYLSGLWSIKPQGSNTEPGGEVYNLINSVVMEEMLHMALACNMVTAIGGTPEINPTHFPGGLPGGVRPDLTVKLEGLSSSAVEMYMQIEEPESHAVARGNETWPTIGAFYDAIEAAFDALQPEIQRDSVQLTASVGVPDPNDPEGQQQVREYLTAITWLGDVKAAIALIKEQGEGTGTSPDAPQYDRGELAHFFRFNEIATGKTLVYSGGRWVYDGDPVPFPECYPVKAVPVGGYPGVEIIEAFDAQYTQLVLTLRKAWTEQPTVTGDSPTLDAAIGIMVSIYDNFVRFIVPKPLPDGTGNYGPDFRMLPQAAVNSPATQRADARVS